MAEQILECEVKEWRDSPEGRVWGWKLMSVTEAKQVGTPLVRCKECHGPLKLLGSTKPGAAPAHAVHINAKDAEYCSSTAEFKKAKDGRRSGISAKPID